MKNTIKYFLFLLISLCSGSCHEEDETEKLLCKTWQQVFQTTNDQETENEFITQTYMQIASNGILQIYNPEQSKTERSGWSYSGGMFNIAIKLPTAFYIEKITQEELILKYYDFSEKGDIETTITGWKAVDSSEFPTN